MPLAIAYLAAFFGLIVPDAVWLTLTGPRLYRPALGDLMADKVSFAPAALFYLIYAVGVVGLAVAPFGTDSPRSALTAAARGALLGLCAYGAYDFTNQATLRRWPTYLTVADIGWGIVVTAFAAVCSTLALRRFGA